MIDAFLLAALGLVTYALSRRLWRALLRAVVRRRLNRVIAQTDAEAAEDTRVEVLSRQVTELQTEVNTLRRKAGDYDRLLAGRYVQKMCETCLGGVEVRRLSDPLPSNPTWCPDCEGVGRLHLKLVTVAGLT